MDTDNKGIRFPDLCYVGLSARVSVKQDTLPLGFMTEDGTDKAATKRKETVNSWANGDIKPRSLVNEPMVGFRLSRSIKRSSRYGTGNVKWRIEDPRGFELEISSPNLAQILINCTIENGEILEECMWARLSGDNVLVPANSDLYITAKTNSERKFLSVKPSSVKIGNVVVLKNGMTGTYCGKMYEIRLRTAEIKEDMGKKPMHVLVDQTGDKPLVYTYAALKPAEIISDAEISVLEAETLANSVYTYYQLSANFIGTPPIQLAPVSKDEISDHTLTVIKVPNSAEFEIINKRTYPRNGEYSVNFVYAEELMNGELKYVKVYNSSAYGNGMRFLKNEKKALDLPQLCDDGLCVYMFREITTNAGTKFKIEIEY